MYLVDTNDPFFATPSSEGLKSLQLWGAGGEVVDIVDEVVAQDCTQHNPSRQRSYNPDATYRPCVINPF